MKLYSCPRCGYSNKIRAHMKKHFLRKRICSPVSSDEKIESFYERVLGEKYPENTLNALECVERTHTKNSENKKCVQNALKCVGERTNDIVCPDCSKKFKHMRYLKQHLSRYNCKRDGLSEQLQNLLNEKDRMIEVQNELRKKDRELIDELKTQVTKLIDRVSITGNTTNNIQNQTNTFNIMLNAFGKEDTSYIQDSFLRSIIKEGPYASIPKLIKAIHFHPNHKENHNILIPNKKQSLAKIYNGQAWEYKNKNDTIDDITDKAYDIIYNHYDDAKSRNKYMDRFIDNFEDQDRDTMKKVKTGAEITILNNQDIVNV